MAKFRRRETLDAIQYDGTKASLAKIRKFLPEGWLIKPTVVRGVVLTKRDRNEYLPASGWVVRSNDDNAISVWDDYFFKRRFEAIKKEPALGRTHSDLAKLAERLVTAERCMKTYEGAADLRMKVYFEGQSIAVAQAATLDLRVPTAAWSRALAAARKKS